MSDPELMTVKKAPADSGTRSYAVSNAVENYKLIKNYNEIPMMSCLSKRKD